MLNSKNIFLLCCPYLYLSISINDFSKLYEAMLRLSTIMFVFASFLLYAAFTGNIDGENVNYMTIAYHISIPVLSFGIFGLEKKSLIRIIIFITATLAILFIGCRGAFIAILFTFIAILFLKYGFRGFLIPILIVLIIAVFYSPIISYISDILNNVGYESRVLYKLQYGGLLESTGRDQIRTLLLTEFQNAQYAPFGLFGDRVIANNSGFGSGVYIHNLFLEILIDFGIILGSLLILLMIYFTIKSIAIADYKTKIIYMLIAGFILVKLCFSSSYLVDYLFYSYIGFTISILTRRINEKSINHNI